MKIYVAANVKSKKITLMKVAAGERVHDDSKALPDLVETIIESNSVTSLGKLFADGVYDNNGIFRQIFHNGILPYINK